MAKAEIFDYLQSLEENVQKAYRHARFGEWGLSGVNLVHAYLNLHRAAAAISLDLDAEARKLHTEENTHGL